jgi:hypothetical protein
MVIESKNLAASTSGKQKKAMKSSKGIENDLGGTSYSHGWELEDKGKINSEIRTYFKVKDFLGMDEQKMLRPSDELPVASTSQGK